jgi:hypothetical protein
MSIEKGVKIGMFFSRKVNVLFGDRFVIHHVSVGREYYSPGAIFIQSVLAQQENRRAPRTVGLPACAAKCRGALPSLSGKLKSTAGNCASASSIASEPPEAT